MVVSGGRTPAEVEQLGLGPSGVERVPPRPGVGLLALEDVAVRGVPGLDGKLDRAGGLGDFGYPIELGAQELACGCGGGAPVGFVCHAHAHGSPAVLGSCRRRRGFGLVGRV